MATYDQPGQKVNTQFNADNITIQAAPGPNADELMARGRHAMKVRAYDEAITAFEEAIKIQPSAQGYYYHALSLLQGRRPKLLTLTDAQAIEQKLRVAHELDSVQAHYLYLWALVKFDFYLANGFMLHPPGIEQLLAVAQSIPINRDATVEMLNHVQLSDNPITGFILDRL
ncbi:MAG: hypothetical protein AB7U82_04015 [Blastocatellales bacterium]